MNLKVAQDIVSSTPLLSKVSRIEFLDKGYSSDKKYVLWEGAKPRFLLRLSDIEFYERRKVDFEMITLHYRNGVKCSEPFLCGVSEGGDVCYAVLGYFEGESAENALPKLPEGKRYRIGFAAGKELLKLHEVTHADPAYGWPERRAAKYRRNIARAAERKLAFNGQAMIESFVEANLGLMDAAPVCFQHDDYHAGNLIVHNGEFAGVIDFNRFDWGDPVEDFYKLPWFSAPVSTAFARGQLQGYLSNRVPYDFWRRYNLYTAMSLHGSLVWTQDYYPEQLGQMQQRIRDILSTHDFENSGPPSWYEE